MGGESDLTPEQDALVQRACWLNQTYDRETIIALMRRDGLLPCKPLSPELHRKTSAYASDVRQLVTNLLGDLRRRARAGNLR